MGELFGKHVYLDYMYIGACVYSLFIILQSHTFNIHRIQVLVPRYRGAVACSLVLVRALLVSVHLVRRPIIAEARRIVSHIIGLGSVLYVRYASYTCELGAMRGVRVWVCATFWSLP